MIAIEETALIDAASHGDGRAFGALVRKYQDRLVTSMAHFIGNPSEAEDVAQEAFVSAYRYLPTFRRGCTFYTWLYRIAMNCAVQWRRRTGRQASLEERCERWAVEPIDPRQSPEEAVLRQERVVQVQAALARLGPQFRSVLVLREIEGMDYRQIGESLGMEVNTVRSRLHRARKALANELRTMEAE